jgi:hypothetical protein
MSKQKEGNGDNKKQSMSKPKRKPKASSNPMENKGTLNPNTGKGKHA